jgi:hypothetical protein
MALLALFALVGCHARISPPGINVPAPSVTVKHDGPPPHAAQTTGAAPVTASGPSCQGDAHCLLPDDIIVCSSSWWCAAAHTLTPPSAETKNQGKFLEIKTGKQSWTDRWFNSRPLAKGEELKLTQRIIFFEHNTKDGVRYPPTSHEKAIKGSWLTARVTDLSDLFKGVVHTSSGRRKVHVSAIRLITSAGQESVEYD